MTGIKVRDLRNDLPFGSVIEGMNWETVKDENVRAEVNDTFKRRGVIVFTGCEESPQFQVALSTVFGPLKDHPTKSVKRSDDQAVEGVIDNYYKPIGSDLDLIEIDGKKLAQWIPWHFDHCYNDELNYAGVLRMLIKAKDGGMTGFADGVDLYKRMPDDLRKRVEGHTVIYDLDVRLSKMRFIPKNIKFFGDSDYVMSTVRESLTFPRALHPAVWIRESGEKVLHVSSWVAKGLEGHEDPEGDALLIEICGFISNNTVVYWHKWEPGQLVIWDNHRFLHAVNGSKPSEDRRMNRTTIKGDYGLGRFEDGKKIGEVQRELVM